jgi:hypothetical protein
MINLLSIFTSALFSFIPVASDSLLTNSSTLIQLDCSNYRLFDFDLTHSTTIDIVQPLTFKRDTLFSFNDQDSLKNRIRIWGDLGSETGELLFDRFDGVAYDGPKFNREHMVYAGSELHLLQNRLQLRGGYHHLGSYSDRIEEKISELSQRYSIDPRYRSVGSYGISEYYFGVWKLELPHVTTRGILSKYGNWILLPIAFDPVYMSGYRYVQDVDISFSSEKIVLSSDCDFQKRFLNHLDYSKVNAYTANASWDHSVSDRLTIGVRAKGNSNYLSRGFFSLHFENKVGDDLLYWFESGIWSNQEPVGEIGLGWKPQSGVKIDLSLKYAYKPGEKEITYLSYLNPTTLSVESLRETKMQSSVEVENILALPVHFRGWISIQKGSPEYAVTQTEKKRYICQEQSENVIAGFGGRLYADLSFYKIMINPWVQANMDMVGQLSESTPRELGIALSYSDGGNNPNKYNVSLTYREPYSLRVKMNGKSQTLSSNSLLFCNLSVVIPFMSPILSQHIKPTFQFQAGPVHLLHGLTRQAFHPFGSEIGPAFSAKMDVDFL